MSLFPFPFLNHQIYIVYDEKAILDILLSIQPKGFDFDWENIVCNQHEMDLWDTLIKSLCDIMWSRLTYLGKIRPQPTLASESLLVPPP